MDSSIISADHTHDKEGCKMFGFIVFLLSETFIFPRFFTAYIVYKTTIPNWLLAGVSGLEVQYLAINLDCYMRSRKHSANLH